MILKYRITHILLFALAAVFMHNSLFGQVESTSSDTTRKNAIRTFFDCRFCDMDYIREEMPYINYVRDVKESQVYLLVTRQSSGSGGGVYTLFFSGQEEFTGMKDTLTYSSRPDDTDATTRAGLTKTIAGGMMRYVAQTPVLSQVEISYTGTVQEEPEQVEDKWNYWVFELQTRPRFDLQELKKEYSWSNSFQANRITPEWKIENEFDQSYNKEIFFKYDTLDSEPIKTREAISSSWRFNQLTVRSISDHWSVGFRGNVRHSTYDNFDLSVSVAPAIEYDIFPYSEANQKQLRILYGIGYKYNDYIDSTVYDKTIEHLVQQTLDIALQVQQSWGSANISLGASNYMHDFSKNRYEFDGFLRVRLFKGFSLNISGSVAFIHDDIGQPKRDVSEAEQYLNLRRLSTNYQYEAGLGITYTFGSIYSNVVNPRFGGGGGFGGGGFGGGGRR